MNLISHRIVGVPYSWKKTGGNTDAPEEWSRAIIAQTKDLPRITEACILKVTFLLPPSKFPSDLPYGPDLDNLMKRLMDALNDTIFSQAKGKDSCVIEMSAMKTTVDSDEEAGALIQVLPIRIR